MDVNNKLFKMIVSTMIIAQITDKKEYVLLEIQKYLSPEPYERYKPIISIMIDGIKLLSKSTLLKNLKTTKCCIYIISMININDRSQTERR